MKIVFVVFFSLLIMGDLLMIVYPHIFFRWTERWFAWRDKIYPFAAWELRLINPMRQIKFVRIYGIAFGLFLAGWLTFVAIKFH